MERHRNETGSPFLPLPFHKVVAISAVIAKEFGEFDRVNTIEEESEAEIIAAFLHFINKHNPRLVTFNGRTFDIPMLMVRALKYNLSCPAYFEQENKEISKNRWENYRSRYSELFHLDLLDSLSHYGAARGLKLDTLCQMAGIPGKFDVSGSQVLDLYYQGERERIKEYCESDAINTYLLFLKYELLKGELDRKRYRELLEKMEGKFPTERSYSEVFLTFLRREIDGCPRD